jgi:AcrR family transcriptional regulator
VRVQRAELLASVRQLLRDGAAINVSNIAGARGMARNTFYEHFASAEEALETTAQEAAEQLRRYRDQALENHGDATPGDVARGVTVGLMEFVDAGDWRWQLLAEHAEGTFDAVLDELVGDLHRVYAHAGAVSVEISPLTVTAARGAVRALMNAYAAKSAPREDVIDHVVVVLNRLLR